MPLRENFNALLRSGLKDAFGAKLGALIKSLVPPKTVSAFGKRAFI